MDKIFRTSVGMTQISSSWRTIMVFHSCMTGIPSFYLLRESPVPPSIGKRTGTNKEDDDKILKTPRERTEVAPQKYVAVETVAATLRALRGRRRRPYRWRGRSRRRPRRHFAPRRPPPAAISRPPAPRAPPDRSAARWPPRPAVWRHGAHLTLWQRPGPWHHPGERPQRLHGTVTVPENASPRLARPPGMSRNSLRIPTLFGWGRCHPAASTSRRRADATACPEAAPAWPRPAHPTLLPTCGRYGNRPASLGPAFSAPSRLARGGRAVVARLGLSQPPPFCTWGSSRSQHRPSAKNQLQPLSSLSFYCRTLNRTFRMPRAPTTNEMRLSRKQK